MEDVKIKLAVLWLGYFCAMVVVPTMALYEPGYIEEIITGELITAELILVTAGMMLIPPVMTVLSVILEGSINRWTNIIVGIVVAGLSLIGPVEFLLSPSVYSAYVLMVTVVQMVLLVLIVWYAWKWPKQEG